MVDEECVTLKEKCNKLNELLSSQWEQNYFIKNRNIELEDRISDLSFQVKQLTKQLEEYKNNKYYLK